MNETRSMSLVLKKVIGRCSDNPSPTEFAPGYATDTNSCLAIALGKF